jgi:hypothetical protein
VAYFLKAWILKPAETAVAGEQHCNNTWPGVLYVVCANTYVTQQQRIVESGVLCVRAEVISGESEHIRVNRELCVSLSSWETDLSAHVTESPFWCRSGRRRSPDCCKSLSLVVRWTSASEDRSHWARKLRDVWRPKPLPGKTHEHQNI